MPKKILLLIPNLGFGGAQRVFSDHSILFAKNNEVEECVFNLSLPNEYPTGNKIHSLEVRAGYNLLDKFFRFLERIKRLKQLKKNGNYDICISHLEGADYINVLSRQSEKIILVVHGSKKADENIKGVVGWIRQHILLPFLYQRADLIVTVSDGIKSELENNYSILPSSIKSIPNYFNIQKIQQLSEQPGNAYIEALKRHHQILLYSGRFANQKNLPVLFTLFKNVKIAIGKLKLVLVGNGECEAELLSECKRLELSFFREEDGVVFNEDYDVFFLGYQKNPFPIIKESDVFIMTSKWEGFPMALCEAMAVGACVVASDCPTGPKQILVYKDERDTTCYAGILRPVPFVEDPSVLKEWESALVDLLTREDLRNHYKTESLKRIVDFSEEHISQHWESVLDSSKKRF